MLSLCQVLLKIQTYHYKVKEKYYVWDLLEVANISWPLGNQIGVEIYKTVSCLSLPPLTVIKPNVHSTDHITVQL